MTTATIKTDKDCSLKWINVNGRHIDLTNHVTGIHKGEYSYQWLIDTDFDDQPHIIEGGRNAGGSTRDWWWILPSNPEYRIPANSFVEAIRSINNGY